MLMCDYLVGRKTKTSIPLLCSTDTAAILLGSQTASLFNFQSYIKKTQLILQLQRMIIKCIKDYSAKKKHEETRILQLLFIYID